MSGGWLETYTLLGTLESDAATQLSRLPVQAVPSGQTLFAPGAACRGFVLVLEGNVRVSIAGSTGRTLVLYRVGFGETCVQTTLCMTSGDVYSAEGRTETPVRLVIVPPRLFDELMATSPAFRSFVFARFGARFNEMIHILESIAFVRVDARLAQALLSHAQGGEVGMTHQGLAEEINSAREVVGRQL